VKRAGGVAAGAIVLAQMMLLGGAIAGTAWADYPRQPQYPDPNRPGRLVNHPPWAAAPPAPRPPRVYRPQAIAVTSSKKHRAAHTKKPATKKEDAPAKPDSRRPAPRSLATAPTEQKVEAALIATRAGAAAAGLAFAAMIAFAFARRRAPA
jgi:hypothetical protein